MPQIELDPQLKKDGHLLREDSFMWLLLMNNAAVPWFIVVPKVTVTELCDLEAEQQQHLHKIQNQLCEFIRQRFAPDKLNVAAIGNVVRQLHLHVIGRFIDDYCWPAVVWGQAIPKRYTPSEVTQIAKELDIHLTGS